MFLYKILIIYIYDIVVMQHYFGVIRVGILICVTQNPAP